MEKKVGLRRRSRSRKFSEELMKNMAEARREIAQALQLHRSSSSSSSSFSSSSSSSSPHRFQKSLLKCTKNIGPSSTTEEENASPPPPTSSICGSSKRVATVLGNGYSTTFLNGTNSYCNKTFVSSSCFQFYCYPLLDTLPRPQPVWSTTAPSVLATVVAPPPPTTHQEATQELMEWAEENDEAASYSWWLGFLKSLDGKKKNIDDDHCCKGVSEVGETTDLVVESCDQYLDEWFVFPTVEDQGKG